MAEKRSRVIWASGLALSVSVVCERLVLSCERTYGTPRGWVDSYKKLGTLRSERKANRGCSYKVGSPRQLSNNFQKWPKMRPSKFNLAPRSPVTLYFSAQNQTGQIRGKIQTKLGVAQSGQSPWFGTKVSQVRILSPRPKQQNAGLA